MIENEEVQPASNQPKAVVNSELTYEILEDRDDLAIGFECCHCNHSNTFNGEDADYLEATGKIGFEGARLTCERCGKDSVLI